jgi:hypothetical protein
MLHLLAQEYQNNAYTFAQETNWLREISCCKYANMYLATFCLVIISKKFMELFIVLV